MTFWQNFKRKAGKQSNLSFTGYSVPAFVPEENTSEEDILEYYKDFQDRLESGCGIMSFLTLSHGIDSYGQLPECYKLVSKLQKYRMLEGYGSCINENHIKDRKSADVVIDEQQLRRMILKKTKRAP